MDSSYGPCPFDGHQVVLSCGDIYMLSTVEGRWVMTLWNGIYQAILDRVFFDPNVCDPFKALEA